MNDCCVGLAYYYYLWQSPIIVILGTKYIEFKYPHSYIKEQVLSYNNIDIIYSFFIASEPNIISKLSGK